MITYSDVILLLTDLQDNGVDVKEHLSKVISTNQIDIDTIKFINDNRELDLTRFYEKIRKSYNNKKSNLYINIMKEIEDTTSVITTLNSYALQIVLFSKEVSNLNQFYRFSRLEDVYKCLYHYSKTFDLVPCLQLLKLIKIDIKTLETTYRKNYNK